MSDAIAQTQFRKFPYVSFVTLLANDIHDFLQAFAFNNAKSLDMVPMSIQLSRVRNSGSFVTRAPLMMSAGVGRKKGRTL